MIYVTKLVKDMILNQFFSEQCCCHCTKPNILGLIAFKIKSIRYKSPCGMSKVHLLSRLLVKFSISFYRPTDNEIKSVYFSSRTTSFFVNMLSSVLFMVK